MPVSLWLCVARVEPMGNAIGSIATAWLSLLDFSNFSHKFLLYIIEQPTVLLLVQHMALVGHDIFNNVQADSRWSYL